MATVLERAKLHFSPMRTNLRAIYIPEWGDGDEGIFYAKALNLKDRQAIEKRGNDEFEIGVEVIVQMLEDHQGEKAFSRADKPEMMRKIDPRVVARVAREILGESDIDDEESSVEQAVKN